MGLTVLSLVFFLLIYIFRFSLDGGATWWYADKGIGPENSDLPRPDFITSETNYPGKATIN